MSSTVSPIPAGYHAVTPYLSISGAAAAIDFYKRAFGAEELYRLEMSGGIIGHAEIQIGDARIMLADDMPGMPDAIARSPQVLKGTTFSLCIYLKDVDARFQQAVAAGAIVKRPVADQFYGDRSGVLQDPFGHVWMLASHVEDVSLDEMKRRMPKG